MFIPRVTFTFLIILSIVNAVLANVFTKFDSNLLLLKIDPSKIDLSQVTEKSIDQPLDHFDSSEKRTFKMRYFERLDLWQPGGPIIIYVGGEGETDPTWISSDEGTLVGQIAKDTNGALLATEHRYYGRSKPDISYDNVTKYYEFLSSHQALADVAYLIKAVKSNPDYKMSKVVVVGGSYAGNLAAWLRELYPELVDAAVASSAPVLAKKDFKEYLEIVAYTFGTYGGVECLNRIQKRFKRYEELLKSSDGIETLKEELSICPRSDLTVLENQQLLFSIQYNSLKRIAQYETPSKVKEACTATELEHVFIDNLNLLKRARSDLSSQDCTEVDFNLCSFTDSWTYQFCTEFGYLQTTTSEIQPFVHWNPLEFNLKFCKDLIKGDKERRIDEGVARTNKMYGGKRPNVTKVVFTHGDMDPWHPLGVLEDLGPDAPVTMVNGTSHCAILGIYEDEPEQLTENRKYVRELIKKWITTS